MENPEKPRDTAAAQERSAETHEPETRPETSEAARPEGEAASEGTPEGTVAQTVPSAETSEAAAAAARKDPRRMQVERILEDDLWEVYRALPAAAREKFKQQGEDLAAELREGLGDPKLGPGKVYGDVTAWLKTIPHVNHHFLMQAAKIKTDKWVDLRADAAGEPAQGLDEL